MKVYSNGRIFEEFKFLEPTCVSTHPRPIDGRQLIFGYSDNMAGLMVQSLMQRIERLKNNIKQQNNTINWLSNEFKERKKEQTKLKNSFFLISLQHQEIRRTQEELNNSFILLTIEQKQIKLAIQKNR